MAPGYTVEIATKVSPARLFQAGVVDIVNLAPKVMPGQLAGIKIIEGDGDVGSVMQVDYTDAVPWGTVKERVDMVDVENMETRCTHSGGGPLKKLESAVCTLKLVPQPDGGTIYRSTVEVNTIPGVEFTDDDMEELKAKDVGQFKALEAYLLANPTAYA